MKCVTQNFRNVHDVHDILDTVFVELNIYI
jgi:hypothetical protein